MEFANQPASLAFSLSVRLGSVISISTLVQDRGETLTSIEIKRHGRPKLAWALDVKRSGSLPQLYPSLHPLVHHQITQLRSVATTPAEFRRLVRSLSLLLAHEATADLSMRDTRVTTPLGQAAGRLLADRVVIVPILRAGIGMAEPLLELLPEAQVWHVGLYRDEVSLEPKPYYHKFPTGARMDVALVVDPMLATGGSASHACGLLKEAGIPRIKLISLIAAPEGIARMQSTLPEVSIHVGSVDERLNSVGYIFPGLGDAGDRQFGTLSS